MSMRVQKVIVVGKNYSWNKSGTVWYEIINVTNSVFVNVTNTIPKNVMSAVLINSDDKKVICEKEKLLFSH